MENQTTAVSPLETGTALTKNNSYETILRIPTTEEIGKLEHAERGMNLSVAYRKQEDWQTKKDLPIPCYFLGLKEIPNDEGEAVTCGAFVDKSGVWLAGQKVLVDAVRTLKPGTPVEITYRGKKQNKSTKGATNLFDIVHLTPVQ